MNRKFSNLELLLLLEDLYKVRNTIVEKDSIRVIDDAIDAIKYLYVYMT